VTSTAVEYHGHLVRFEWQSKHAVTASALVCGELHLGSAVTGGFVCVQLPYGTSWARANSATPPRASHTSRRSQIRRRDMQ
jgi:hypothetical protein